MSPRALEHSRKSGIVGSRLPNQTRMFVAAAAEWLVTSSFASLSTLSMTARERLRWLPILLGLETEFPSVVITATDPAGQVLASGSSTGGKATFKFQLSGLSVCLSVCSIIPIGN